MSTGTRDKIDTLGNEMLKNPDMEIRDIQANTLGILSSMYDEALRRHEETSNSIKAVDFKMQIIVWIGGIIAGAIILNLMGNIFSISEIKSFSNDNQEVVEVINK
jgi:hypothetical protein